MPLIVVLNRPSKPHTALSGGYSRERCELGRIILRELGSALRPAIDGLGTSHNLIASLPPVRGDADGIALLNRMREFQREVECGRVIYYHSLRA